MRLEEIWTGDCIFENEWPSFRTKKDRSLELTCVFQELMPGRRKVPVKGLDVFLKTSLCVGRPYDENAAPQTH